MSNCSNKLSQVKTTKNLISDHCYLTVDYNSKRNQIKPRFRWVRKYQNLTKPNIIYEVENNAKLQTLFKYSNPNTVAEILQTELNAIINKLAPKRRVQIKN